MSAERREHERFELIATVHLTGGGPPLPFVTINVSAGGILLRNDSNLAIDVGEQIRITIDVPALRTSFSIDAKIVRVVAPTAKTGLIAAMWASSDTAATASLGDLLWKLRGHGPA